MDKKVLMIAPIDSGNINNSGVIQKLQGQKSGFESMGYRVDLVAFKDRSITINSNPKGNNYTSYTFFRLNWYRLILPYLKLEDYKIFWIRYTICTPAFIHFLKKAKQASPTSKVIIDMPTYPYQYEWKGLEGRLALALDYWYQQKLHRYVNTITHSGPEKIIWRIPTTYMSNGVSTSAYKRINRAYNSTIHLLAIGKWQTWHGLDRLIKQGDFLRNDMILHVIGAGPALESLKSIVNAEQKEAVIFHGALVGSDLDCIADQCHLGVGTLGLHRKQVSINVSLKHRDYCMRGLPFIYSSVDPDFENQPFVWKSPADDSNIDLRDLRVFYTKLNPQEIAERMRTYAEQNLSWTSKISTVISSVMNT